MLSKIALALCVLPPAGFGMLEALRGNHPLAPLGLSMVMVGTPAALVVSILAFRRRLDRPFALTALVLSSLELLLLGAFLVWTLYLD